MTWGSSAAAAAAVALLLAGCSSGGAAHESAEPAGVADATASASAVVESEWVDVSGQGATLPRDVHGAQYSPEPIPGTAIFHWSPGGDEAGTCTLGPAVRQTTTGRTGFLTAGHCGESPYTPEQHLADGPNLNDAVKQPFGVVTGISPTEDVGVIWTSQAAGVSTIAGFPVVGAMSTAELNQLPEGTPVCVNGAVSGVVCKRFNGVVNNNVISYGHTEQGDSGSPVFVVNRKREVVLVAVYTNMYTATIIDRTLRRLGVEPITAG